ncbi:MULTISPECIES: O-antigen ligase family protein [unclassified Campylobacter]|uniref:O-antigen ligase family protein n=1 Tax=unclassified Campylobacter TaxID=2593542 RepID=UPI0022E9D068|nr:MULTISPECIES: O-antigen ligase family protein [unclassified Campylobacter]MDA3053862.1 O-antigen ligase family protein [Campylobacter sp. VBCF_07 NA4]MDA3060249.1 O-antigen ligase family protein [Campylobacter sp. VBCF_02 NA5]MDA3069765.1 O-antigen ligase family protein [Campylobacter sp. VBCF_08 NA3]WBR54905.1 O-antigen ligase family protein [Campylobacter sp. VBCF_01 NA2]
MVNSVKTEGKFDFFKAIFLFALAVWTMSLPFKNAVYQVGFVLFDLVFLSHLIYFKNFALVREILQSVKFLAFCFVGILIAMIISNSLNTEFLSKKSWEIIALFPFRYGLVFVGLCYFYRLKFFGEKELKVLVFAGLFLLLANAVFYIVQNPQILTKLKDGGITGGLSTRTAFGFFAGLGFVLSLTLVKNYVFKAIFSIIFLFFVIFSFTRSAWVGCFACLILFCAFNIKNYKLILSIFVCLVAFALVAYFGFDSVAERFSDLANARTSGRNIIWAYSLEMISEHPIFGWGVDTFRNLANSPVLKNSTFNGTHNMILELLLHTGIFGFIIYMSAILSNFWLCIKERKFEIFIIFAYFFVVMQFDSSVFTSKEALSYLLIFTFLLYSKKIQGRQI